MDKDRRQFNCAAILIKDDRIANMVYAMREENVESVMVGGHWLMEDHKLLTVNEMEIIQEAKQRAKAITQRADIHLPDRFNVVDK